MGVGVFIAVIIIVVVGILVFLLPNKKRRNTPQEDPPITTVRPDTVLDAELSRKAERLVSGALLVAIAVDKLGMSLGERFRVRYQAMKPEYMLSYIVAGVGVALTRTKKAGFRESDLPELHRLVEGDRERCRNNYPMPQFRALFEEQHFNAALVELCKFINNPSVTRELGTAPEKVGSWLWERMRRDFPRDVERAFVNAFIEGSSRIIVSEFDSYWQRGAEMKGHRA